MTKKNITNKHTIVFIMQLLKSEGPEDQLKCQALVSLLQVSKCAVAFLVSCFVVMFVCRGENNPPQWQKNSFISARQCKKHYIYSTAQKFEAVPGKTRCKARVPPLTLTEMQSEWTAEKNKESIKICCFLPRQRQPDSVHCHTVFNFFLASNFYGCRQNKCGARQSYLKPFLCSLAVRRGRLKLCTAYILTNQTKPKR